MQNLPSVQLNYNQNPEKTFQELHGEFHLEDIEESLFIWVTDHLSSNKLANSDIQKEMHLYFLIRKALHQTQRIANDLSVSAMDLSNTETTAQA